MSDLLPCPFCKSVDLFVERDDLTSAYVMCNSCGAHGPSECQKSGDEETPGESAARKTWNARHNQGTREEFERFIVHAGFTDWTRHGDGYLKPLVDRLWRAWPGVPAQGAPDRRWTEDELALAFFDYAACAERRCDWQQPEPCLCRTEARRAVWLVKNVLPNSFPMASAFPSTESGGQ